MAKRNEVNLRGASKPRLGQHFLSDRHAAEKIVDALGDIAQRVVLEIGPGKGVLTNMLAPLAGRLIAIELDRILATELRYSFSRYPQVEILEADVLNIAFPTLLHPL